MKQVVTYLVTLLALSTPAIAKEKWCSFIHSLDYEKVPELKTVPEYAYDECRCEGSGDDVDATPANVMRNYGEGKYSIAKEEKDTTGKLISIVLNYNAHLFGTPIAGATFVNTPVEQFFFRGSATCKKNLHARLQNLKKLKQEQEHKLDQYK